MNRLLRYAAASNGPLADNRQHQFAAQFALEIFEPRAIYSLIPKNACSTLRFALSRANGAISNLDQINWIHENTHTFRAGLRELATATYTFVVLRCPFRRLASAFLDKIVGRYPPFWRAFPQSREQVDPGRITFRDFTNRICAPGGVGTDVHWRRQTDFLVYQDYDDWFCLKDFAKARNTLKNRIGLDITDTRPALTHDQTRGAATHTGPLADLPITDLAALQQAGSAPDYKMLFDTQIAERVARTYAEDIALYADRFGTRGLLFPKLASTALALQETSQ